MRFFGWKNVVIMILAIVAAGEAMALRRLWVRDAKIREAKRSAAEASAKFSSDSVRAASVENPRREARPASVNVPGVMKRLKDLQAARKLAQTNVPSVLSFDGSLNPEFAEFYGLNAAGRARLQTVLSEAARAQRRLDVAHTTVRSVDAETIEVKVAAYPKQGGVIHDRLTDEFRTVLGEDRFAAFMELSSMGMLGPFGDLGTKESTFTVRWNAQAKTYHSKEEYTLGDSMKGTGESTFQTLPGMDQTFYRLAWVITADKLPKPIGRSP